MALQLTGLKAKALQARSSLDKIGQAYDAFNANAATHSADLASITKDLEGMAEDLNFATQTLGNSVAVSNGSEPVNGSSIEVPPPLPVIVPKAPQEPSERQKWPHG